MDLVGFPAGLRLSPSDWPVGAAVPPGDLSRFVPQGFGLGAPPILLPYSGAPPEGAYGFSTQHGHPFQDAPLSEPAGGTLYFDDGAGRASIRAAVEIMGVYDTLDFAAFAASSPDPVAERYLDQMRLITHFALGSFFQAKAGASQEPQSVSVIDAIVAFVEAQCAKWNGAGAYSPKLAGSAGGDGDWAKESLAFGFHVENTYWGVYRVWSRPWLVTK